MITKDMKIGEICRRYPQRSPYSSVSALTASSVRSLTWKNWDTAQVSIKWTWIHFSIELNRIIAE